MTAPSLLISPDRYKAGKLYSQLPQSGAGDFSVVRNTVANRVNDAGVLVSEAANVPRIDFGVSSCPALLVEPAATNQVRNNTMVGAVAGTPGTLPTNWSTSALGTLSQQIVAVGTELGVQYIDIRISGTASNSLLRLFFEGASQIVAANGQIWTNSAYLRAISAPLPPLSYSLETLERTSAGGFVTSATQSIIPTSTLSRFSYTRTLAGGVTVERVQSAFRVDLTIGASYDFTIRIGLPQMELGSVATSAIRTSGTIQTRNADVISLTGASSLIGQTQGTLYAEVDVRNFQVNGRILSISDDSSNNRVVLILNTSSRINAIVSAGGVSQANIITSSLPTGIYKIAFAYAANDFVLYVNGSQIGTDTSGTIPACSSIYLGKQESSSSSNFLNDRIRAAALYTTRLANAELAQLTTL